MWRSEGWPVSGRWGARRSRSCRKPIRSDRPVRRQSIRTSAFLKSVSRRSGALHHRVPVHPDVVRAGGEVVVGSSQVTHTSSSPVSRVRGWRGARRVRCVCSARFRGGAQSGSRRSISTPCPPNRTCGFPASGSPAGSCLSHAERRFRVTLAVPEACVSPASRGCTASPAWCPSPSRRRACSRPGGAGPPIGPAPPLSHVMLRNSPPLHAGFVGDATPAGFRSSVIPPRLRPLSSTGITPRPRYYGPLRHPAGPACPSRGSGCRVHGADRASRVAAPSIFHACRRHYPGGNRSVRPSPSSRPASGLPLLTGGSASATCVSRPARRSLAFRPAWSLSRPRRSFCQRLQLMSLPP